jgi:hypothetical protein
MKLISPDYNEESEKKEPSIQDSPLSKLPKKTLSELSMMKSRSRENIAGIGADNVSAEVSFHMARPATVISSAGSAASSPNVSNLSGDATRQSPHVSSVTVQPKVSPTTISRSPPQPAEGARLPNPETRPAPDGPMDWTSLVDTATKAIYSNSPAPSEQARREEGSPAGREGELRTLRERVAGLEEQLTGERRGRGELEAQVNHSL